MKRATICYCLRDNQVLLGMKKRGFGEGKWNGYGGKVNEAESPLSAAIRELKEESEIVAEEKSLIQVAILSFYFDKNPVFECHVFITHNFAGEAVETTEMYPQWYDLDSLPFASMWAADIKWLPLLLKGEKIIGTVYFNTDGSAVEDFNYKLVTTFT